MAKPRVAYAANRRIGLNALQMMLDLSWEPVALIVTKGRRADFAEEMKSLLPGVPLLEGSVFRKEQGVKTLRSLDIDYLLSVHFPYIIPQEVLDIPAIGTLNLHPAYLPYNRGWHTPSWAIWEQTPYGATLHWIDDAEGVDTGDIALQECLEVSPGDTAHTLYQRVLILEEVLFREALPLLLDRRLPRIPQDDAVSTAHVMRDLAGIQRLDLSERVSVADVLRRLRALTTNDWDEAAYFETENHRYRIRVQIEGEEL